MKTSLAEVNSVQPYGETQSVVVQASCRRSHAVGLACVFVVGAAVLCITAMPMLGQQAAQSISIAKAKCVIGCENIKTNANGTLSVQPSGLEFATEKQKADITIASITDIYTGNESRQDITGAAQVAAMAIPYGGSRVLSLFSHKVEVLTLEYVDSYGGFHGSIFVLPAGKATSVKDQLVAQGAKASEHVASPAPQEKTQ
jgi:hypothetical protein